ncbi:MAG: mannitol dehydrogenase family protein [Alphaproteobacteria bacterium]|nr:mannitol dehydrogenase family protein [Alphaproteobacteria bacterium]
MRLSDATLPLIKDANPSVEIPVYDRSKLKPGIVHIGPGNFPLAHIAQKTHDLMQSGDADALNYGIVGVSLQTPGRSDQLTPQDGLYTVVEQEPSGTNKMTVVGSVLGAMYAPENPRAVIDRIASADTRIVSMTIRPETHQSYMDGNGGLNLAHPDIANDLDPANPPKTIFGYIVRGVQQREAQGLSGLTVMNLDNMEHNGDVLGRAMRDFTAAYDPALLAAFDAKIIFPNSMVDRIVPGSTPELVRYVTAQAAYIDAAAIPAEPMPKVGSWVIEEKFANGRPAWEKIGAAQVVADVLPYEKMKLRLLNVSHAAIANLGDLMGYKHIDETMQDPLFRNFMKELMENETGPTLLPVPGIDLPAYKDELVARFANTAVKDTTARVARDAPLKVVLDSAQDQLNAGGCIELLALTTAAWMRRFGVEANEQGGQIKAEHPMVDILKAKAAAGGSDPTAMFGVTEVFGSIGQNKRFADTVAIYLDLLEDCGVALTMMCALSTLKNEAGLRPAQGGQPAPVLPVLGKH